jgi:hypothetical protein
MALLTERGNLQQSGDYKYCAPNRAQKPACYGFLGIANRLSSKAMFASIFS